MRPAVWVAIVVGAFAVIKPAATAAPAPEAEKPEAPRRRRPEPAYQGA